MRPSPTPGSARKPSFLWSTKPWSSRIAGSRPPRPDKPPQSAPRAGNWRLSSATRRDLDLAVRFVDRVARPEDPRVAARDLARISPQGRGRRSSGRLDLGLLAMGTVAAPLAPPLVVPLARRRLRQIIGHLVVDARDPALARAPRRTAALRVSGLNVNLLGEAVLGETEAANRTRRTAELLQRDDVDYVSIKVSSLVSQISTWDTGGTGGTVRAVPRSAAPALPGRRRHGADGVRQPRHGGIPRPRPHDGAVHRLLDEDEFLGLEAGIVLQAYLPDALPAHGAAHRAGRRPDAPAAARRSRSASSRAPTSPWSRSRRCSTAGSRRPTRPRTTSTPTTCAASNAACARTSSDAVRLGVASHNLFDVAVRAPAEPPARG